VVVSGERGIGWESGRKEGDSVWDRGRGERGEREGHLKKALFVMANIKASQEQLKQP
jgi:hypothetical protein